MDLPIKHGDVLFHSYVSLPEGNMGFSQILSKKAGTNHSSCGQPITMTFQHRHEKIPGVSTYLGMGQYL